jgi:hypothetical protein
MAQFDIIAASSNAYKSVWASRQYLGKLALAPFLIKSACLVFASSFAGGQTTAFLFFMLPALFAEGWMLSHFTRYLVLGQTWPFRPTGNMEEDMAVLRVRARGVLSGTVVYVLIGMALGALTLAAQAYLLPYVSKEALESGAPIPTHIGMISMLGLGFMFWGFRLVWLYIPVALNSDAKFYLFRMRGLGTSVSLIGVWLLCLLPFLLVLQLLAGIVAAPIGGLLGASAGYFVMTLMVAAADTVKSLIVTAGITNGMREIYAREDAR